jgi:photosystem II stability/assembly factor-like uncharacterized protein
MLVDLLETFMPVKTSRCFSLFVGTLLLLMVVVCPNAPAQEQIDAKLFSQLHWRLIGPFRGGRVTAVAGVPGDANTFYFGTPGGGVWKTTDGAQTWRPIFDSVPVPSIGALGVAAFNTNIIYVGTGEQTPGRGVYRSSDAGKSWSSAGLEDVPFIQAIIVDPQNPDVAVVGANSIGFGILWRPLPAHASTAKQGIFRTEDSGKSWQQVYKDDNSIGVVDMCSDLSNPRTLYAVLYHPASGSGKNEIAATSDLAKSTDGGASWSPVVQVQGLPEKARGRMGIAVAPKTDGRRLYAIVSQGFYRSDDGGATWQQSTKDPRIIGSNYFSRVFVDPNDPDMLYVAQTSLYRSTDGGRTFEAYVGAPSGDDFHVLWIDPRDSRRMVLGVDQGAIVTVDGGKSWSSWYNQPTGQFYHISTDNAFPYSVYAAQQDSGTAAVLSRSNYGEILLQDWHSIAGFEYAFIAPDPKNPNLIYSNGWYGSVVRYDNTTGQVATLFEHGKDYRPAQMAPLVFSPQDPSKLYFGTQFVMKTTDGGTTWQKLSPDLTGYGTPPEEEKRDPDKPRPPAITSLAPSPLQAGLIWAGTSNRLVKLTRDEGGTWQDVSPSGQQEPLRVLYVEASHHDAGTAYLTTGAARESTPPNVVRTHDYGQSWQPIVNGFPADQMVRVVREDPKRKGLLYAGTDTAIFISWDDGDHWQPLPLNLPSTPITDLTVHDNDLVISTFGRALWIFDDLSPLREITPQIAAADFHLFEPEGALRVRWDNYEDTPFPPETPAGQNPPDGAIIDYLLKSPGSDPLTLTIYDDQGSAIAKSSSDPKAADLAPANAPEYWFAPPTALSKTAGVNRFVWNLRYTAPLTLPYGYNGELLGYTEYTLADHAVPELTPREQPQGPLVVPGRYTLEMTRGSQKLRQELTVGLDPRLHVAQSDLVAQRDLALQVSRGMASSYASYHQVASVRDALPDEEESKANGSKTSDTTEAFKKKLDSLLKGTNLNPGFGPVNRDLARLLFSVESADMRPTDSVRSVVQQSCDALAKNLATWQQLVQQDVKALNAKRAKQKQKPLPTPAVSTAGCS